MRTNTTLSSACVPEARVHCADPERTMLHADKLPKHLRCIATWSSAGQLHAVLVAMPTSFECVAGAACFNTLAFCSMFEAQAKGFCCGGTPFNRARCSAVRVAKLAFAVGVGGAVIHHTFLCRPLLWKKSGWGEYN